MPKTFCCFPNPHPHLRRRGVDAKLRQSRERYEHLLDLRAVQHAPDKRDGLKQRRVVNAIAAAHHRLHIAAPGKPDSRAEVVRIAMERCWLKFPVEANSRVEREIRSNPVAVLHVTGKNLVGQIRLGIAESLLVHDR